MPVSSETPTESPASPPLSRVGLAAAFLLPIVLLAPFANKAYHIDDPLQLWTAQHIHEEPFDFYGFDIVMRDVMPMYQANQNPPGTPYLLALWALVFGWSEVALHMLMAAVTGMLGLGTYVFASRFTRRPMLATVLAVTTPAVLVTGNTVMTDIPMTTLYVWGLALWVRGFDAGSHTRWAAAVCVIGLSTWFKYFGVTAVLLMLAYGVLRERRLGWWSLYLLVPAGFLGAYEWITYELYGVGLFSTASAYAGLPTGEAPLSALADRGRVGLMFVGGSLLCTLALAPLMFRKWILAAIAGAALLLGAIYYANPGAVSNITSDLTRTAQGLLALQGALFAVAGAVLMAVAAADLLRRRDADSAILVLCVVGTFVFSTMLNWTINVRTMLPMIPAAAILLARRLEDRPLPRLGRIRAEYLAAAAALSVSLCVVWGDYRLAGTGRDAAEQFSRDDAATQARYLYEGGWGFHYYMVEKKIPFMVKAAEEHVRPGDRIAVQRWGPIAIDYDAARARIDPALGHRFVASRWISTLHPLRGAGFHAHTIGPLPYAFLPSPPQFFDVYVLGIYDAPH